MTSTWLLYLAAATGCQVVFALFYSLGLARLSTFSWNRAYLLISLVISTLLPLVALPGAWAQWLWPVAPTTTAALSWPLPLGAIAAPSAAAEASARAFRGEWLVLGIYWLGVAWQVGRTARSLGWLYGLQRRYPRTRLSRGWLVQLPEPSRPAFSFGRHVFLSPAHAQLSSAEYAQLIQHEQVHGAQYHSLDLLLAEVLGWFFWFNGLVAYLRRQLRTVHEYLADAAVTQAAGSRVAYGHLLLKLATEPLPASLVHPFATKQVAQRIHMLTSPPSSPMKKLRFLLVAPAVALAWLGAAALQPTPALAIPAATAPAGKVQGRIGTINWQGNTYLTAAQLNEALGLEPGDAYSKEAVEARLNNRPDGRDITSRYMDNGYLFFQIDPVAKTRPDGHTDLTFVLTEGPVVRVNTLTVKGNRKVATADVLKLVTLRQGEPFSRAELIESRKALSESGYFVPREIGVNPQPIPDKGLVNIEFVVLEK